MAESIETFMQERELDICNTLLGQHPNHKILIQMRTLPSNANAFTIDCDNDIASHESEPLEKGGSSDGKREIHSVQQDHFSAEKQEDAPAAKDLLSCKERDLLDELIKQVFRWESMKDNPTKVMMEIETIASRVRKKQPCLPGMLVVVEINALPEDVRGKLECKFDRQIIGSEFPLAEESVEVVNPLDFAFARVATMSATSIGLFIDPNERHVEHVPMNRVRYFTSASRVDSSLSEKFVDNISSVTFNVSEFFYKSVTLAIEEEVLKGAVAYGVDEESLNNGLLFKASKTPGIQSVSD
tara:strand:- start:511 stop:1404 length:894 start_codon:yes stop_codon:yes gene_type:complete